MHRHMDSISSAENDDSISFPSSPVFDSHLFLTPLSPLPSSSSLLFNNSTTNYAEDQHIWNQEQNNTFQFLDPSNLPDLPTDSHSLLSPSLTSSSPPLHDSQSRRSIQERVQIIEDEQPQHLKQNSEQKQSTDVKVQAVHTSPAVHPPSSQHKRIREQMEETIKAENSNDSSDDSKECVLPRAKKSVLDRERRHKVRALINELGKQLRSIYDVHSNVDQLSILQNCLDTLKRSNEQIQNLQSQLKDHSGIAQAYEQQLSMFQQYLAGSVQLAAAGNPSTPSHSILNHTGISMARLGPDGRIIEVNDVFCKLTQFSEAEIVGSSPPFSPLLIAAFHVPTDILNRLSPAPVVDTLTQLHSSLQQAPAVVFNDLNPLFSPVQEQTEPLPSAYVLSAPSTVYPLARNTQFNVPIERCHLLYGPEPHAPSKPSILPWKRVQQFGRFRNFYDSLPPHACIEILHRLTTKSNYILEMIVTVLPQWRDGKFLGCLLLSMPDLRKYAHSICPQYLFPSAGQRQASQ